MAFGMIGYGVPCRVTPTPTTSAARLRRHRGAEDHYSLYLMSVYADSAEERALRAAFAKAGKRLDMASAACASRSWPTSRWRRWQAIAAVPVDAFVARYEASRRR